MNFDDLKSAWQAQSAGAQLKVDAALLLNELRRNERHFQRTLLWRDAWEIAVALTLLPVWLVMGNRLDLPWTWYLMVPSLLWMAGFMAVNRVWQRRHRAQPDDTLRQSVERSLAQVEHQIWLLRNIAWWYLLPLVAPMATFLAHTGAERRAWEGTAYPTTLGVVVLVTWGAWWLNRRAVRAELEPRRRELETLWLSLGDSEGESHPIAPGLPPPSPKRSTGKKLLILFCVIGIVVALFVWEITHWLPVSAKSSAGSRNAAAAIPPAAGDEAVTAALKPILQKPSLLAMAAIVVTSDDVQRIGAVGVRKRGSAAAF